MLEVRNKTDYNIDFTNLKEIAKEVANKNYIELIIVNSKEMQKINKTNRGIDKPTDVLSFPIEQFPHSLLGSTVINIEIASQNAKQLNHTLKDELAILFIHSLLHLLGYDHIKDDTKMKLEEQKLTDKFNLPFSLIQRVEC